MSYKKKAHFYIKFDRSILDCSMQENTFLKGESFQILTKMPNKDESALNLSKLRQFPMSFTISVDEGIVFNCGTTN